MVAGAGQTSVWRAVSGATSEVGRGDRPYGGEGRGPKSTGLWLFVDYLTSSGAAFVTATISTSPRSRAMRPSFDRWRSAWVAR